MKRFRGGLVFKAHRWLYHSTLGSRVIKKKKAPPRIEEVVTAVVEVEVVAVLFLYYYYLYFCYCYYYYYYYSYM